MNLYPIGSWRWRGRGGINARMVTFREKFVLALDASGMSMAELSRRSGVSYQVIDKLKKGRVSSTTVENAQRLSAALGIDRNHNAQADRVAAMFLQLPPHHQETVMRLIQALLGD